MGTKHTSDGSDADDATPPSGGENGDFPASEFRICDAESANWLVRRVVEARAYRERVERWAEREIRRAAADEDRLLFLFGAQLEAWASAEISKLGGRRKSVCLPAGRIGYRKRQPKLVIDDTDAVIRWAKIACPGAVLVRENLDKSALTAHLRNTGEVPDTGAHVVPEHEAFFIE